MQSLLPFEKIKREVLVRKESATDPKFGKSPDDRNIKELLERGIVNINKPKGPTSHQISGYVRDIFKVKKGGHSGTLDPRVTGVLPIAFDKATRIVQFLLPAGKEYVCIMHLHDEIPENKIIDVMKSKFVGKIRQLPPVKSAIKRQMRNRKIYYLDILEIDGRDVLFRVGCQAGTYIRKLCHDIGLALGTSGHMAQLVRTKAGPFDESTMYNMQDLTDAVHYWKDGGDEAELRKIIQPIENAVLHLPRVWVLDAAVSALSHGSNLKVPGISKVESEIQVDEMVAIMSLKDELVCVGKSRMTSKQMLNEKNGIAIKTESVFIDPDVYPRLNPK